MLSRGMRPMRLALCGRCAQESKRILGVHIIGTDACEMVHYGMSLVEKEATIFDLIGTLFTAVTFHELFKEAAFNGNSKLEYGIEWQQVLSELCIALPQARAAHRIGSVKSALRRASTSQPVIDRLG